MKTTMAGGGRGCDDALLLPAGVHRPPPYGTFPAPPPSPLPPPAPVYHAVAIPVGHPRSHPCPSHGYVVDGVPMAEPPLPFCGIGVGWALFLSGFLFAAIPWYVGVFILLFVVLDYREKPGLIACTFAAVLTFIPVILNVFRFHVFW